MRVLTVTIILITMAFAGVPTARGQSTSSDGERIRKLRDEIQKRETADTPEDLIELNRSKLMERRAELRTLLKSEMVKLQKHQRDMASFISPEETQRINDLLQTYTAEVNRLGVAMQADLAADASAGSGPASATAADSPTKLTPNLGNGSASQPAVPVTAPAPAGDGTGPSSTGAAAVLSSSSDSGLNLSRSSVAATNAPAAVPANATESKETLDCDAVLEKTKASSDSKQYSEVDKITCGLVEAVRDRSDNKLDLGRPDWFRLVKILIAKKLTPQYLVEASEVRLDKQVGASSVNGVSPSLITHGGVPFILGFAVENGGLTQTTNNTAITFRGNPVGLFNALKNKGFMESVKQSESDPLLNFLKRTSFALTFNTDRGREPGVFTGSSQQLSSISARIELINRRVPTFYIKDWENFIANEAQHLTDVIEAQADNLVDDTGTVKEWKDPILKSWFDQTQAKLATTSDADISAVLQTALNEIPVENLETDAVLALQAIEQALGANQTARQRVLEKINSGLVVTLDYLNKREINLPDTSNFMFIAEKGTGGGKVNFTFNGSLTIFNNLDSLRNFVKANPTLPTPRRVRDFQFAGGIDIPFGNVRQFGQWVLFANGRYERLLENATTEIGEVLPNTTGDIGQFQMGLKIPVAKTGFKIPVSITFANRTELIKERTVKGNFGFSLDLDTLFSKFKPF